MELIGALTRLDADIARLESQRARLDAQLTELRAMRKIVEPFLAKYVGVVLDTDTESPKDRVKFRTKSSHPRMSDRVKAVFAALDSEFLDIDEVFEAVKNDGHDSGITRDAVRNAIHHALHVQVLTKGPKRGTYRLTNVSAPVATGAERAGESSSVQADEEPTSSQPKGSGGHGAHGQLHQDRPMALDALEDEATATEEGPATIGG